MKKYILSSVSILAIILPKFVYAMCPVCTVAVGAGLGLARWLKIDDTISGLWIGALIVSLTMWTISWLNKKNIKFFGRKILITFVYYFATIYPLYYYGMINHPLHTFWGIDKLILGIIIGTVSFFSFAMLYLHLKKRNQNHAHFPFEKIVLTILPLVILSVAFYFLTK